MQGFEDIKLTWKGAEYVIPADRVLRAIAKIEDAIRGDSDRQAIQILTQKPGPTFTRIAMGYAAALQSAGAAVSADEVYLTIMQGLADGDDHETALGVQSAIFSMLAIMSPPIALALSEDDTEKKSQAAV